MSISALNAQLTYQTVGGLSIPSSTLSSASTAAAVASVTNPDLSAALASAGNGNNSSLATAITQALAQSNSNLDLTSLLSPQGQQSSSDFLSSLYAALPGNNSASTNDNSLADLLNPSGSQVSPVQLNASSPTINLQTNIQQLITNLGAAGSSSDLVGSLFGDDSSGSDSSTSSAAANLQSSFNQLVTNSGGNPSQSDLQSFLKLVAANIQNSSSIGSLFDTSA